jgi:RND superfamily putative drug exporter
MTTGAAIMVCVGSFVIGGPLRILAVFGLGLAAAVLIDAPAVRMMLVPAVMQLLGPANWWLPRWIERAIPHLAIEPKLDHLSAGRDLGPAGGAGKVSGGPKETATA